MTVVWFLSEQNAEFGWFPPSSEVCGFAMLFLLLVVDLETFRELPVCAPVVEREYKVSFRSVKRRLTWPLLSVLSRTAHKGHCIVWCSVLAPATPTAIRHYAICWRSPTTKSATESILVTVCHESRDGSTCLQSGHANCKLLRYVPITATRWQSYTLPVVGNTARYTCVIDRYNRNANWILMCVQCVSLQVDKRRRGRYNRCDG